MRKILISRLTKALLILAAVLVGPGLLAASADTIFTFGGTFQDGSALSGTMTINTATGAIDGVNLKIGANSFTFMQGPPLMIGGELFVQLTTTSNFSFPYLDIFFPVSSLVGYNGGALCISPTAGDCSNPTQFGVGDNKVYYLTSNAVPEPSSLLLLMGGLVGLGLLGRKMQFGSSRA